MPDWTLTYDGDTQTFADWGLSGLAFNLVNFDVSTATFQHAADYDGEALFPFNGAAVIKLGSTVVFTGWFGEVVRTREGVRERLGYVLNDVMWKLTRLPFQQAWSAATFGAVTLFSDASGARTTIAEQLEQIITFASDNGLPIQFGTAANLAQKPPVLDLRDASCAAALEACRKWAPDMAALIDHTTTPPTISFVRRADASAVTWGTESVIGRVMLKALEETQVSQVVLKYIVTNSIDGEGHVQLVEDVYPAESTGLAEAAVVQTFDVQGYSLTYQKQFLGTNNISPNSKTWWGQKFPWLRDATGDDYDITDGERLMEGLSGDLVTDSSGSSNEITDGALPAWESGTSRRIVVRAIAKKFYIGDVFYDEYKLEASVMATNMAGGTYVKDPDYVAGESIPTGMAQLYYEATHPLHFAGTLTRKFDELPVPLPQPGRVLNLSDGESVARGWTTMNALIQAVSVDVQNAVISLTVGPPEHLSPQDLVELNRARAGLLESRRVGARVNGVSSAAVTGGRSTANSHVSPPPQPAVQRGNLTVYSTSAGHFSIRSGLVNGALVKKDTVSGADIDDASPPDWTISGDGVIYLGIKFTPTYDTGTLASFTGPVCFVAKATTLPAEDTGEAEFVIRLADVVDGRITNNYSPGSNLWAILRDAGLGDSTVRVAVAKA